MLRACRDKVEHADSKSEVGDACEIDVEWHILLVDRRRDTIVCIKGARAGHDKQCK